MRRLLEGFLFIIFISASGCVSFSLSDRAAEKAGDVSFRAPSSPFEKLDTSAADRAWINSKNGNSISYLSECGTKADPSLSYLQGESLNAISKAKVLEEKSMPFNGRDSLIATASGDVDGIPVRMRVLSLKKNGCNYTITYTGVDRFFDEDISAFNDFLDGFTAP